MHVDPSVWLGLGTVGGVRLWEVETGRCVQDGQRALSGAVNGVVRIWNLPAFVAGTKARKAPAAHLPIPLDQVQYTNAKVLLVGDSGVGKTGLANRLALGRFEETDSTDGAWATHWPLHHAAKKDGVEREIWLWDFAGQVDLNDEARQECRAGRQECLRHKALLQQFEMDLFHRAKTSSSVNGAIWFHKRPQAIFQRVCAAMK